jgi:hypothetical protein
MLRQSNPKAAEELLKEAQQDVMDRWRVYEHWASMPFNGGGTSEPKPAEDKAVSKGAGND